MSCLPPRREKKRHVSSKELHYVVIGGGIAGVSCTQELYRLGHRNITLISSKEMLKEIKSTMKITNHLEEFTVFERNFAGFCADFPGVRVIIGAVERLDHIRKTILLEDRSVLSFDKLCICTGAQPNVVVDHDRVIGLRDVDSIMDLANKLKDCKSVGIVGNGGLALELVHVLNNCEIHWIVRDDFIGSMFFDASSSDFILPSLSSRRNDPSYSSEIKNNSSPNFGATKRKYGYSFDSSPSGSYSSHSQDSSDSSTFEKDVLDAKRLTNNTSTLPGGQCGAALGPDWAERTAFKNLVGNICDTSVASPLHIYFEQQIEGFRDLDMMDHHYCEWKAVNSTEDLMKSLQLANTNECKIDKYDNESAPSKLQILTSSGKIISCDFVISATGVRACNSFLDCSAFTLNPVDGSIRVDYHLSTGFPDIYAAGDCCSIDMSSVMDSNNDEETMQHPVLPCSLWFQMKLWTQARLMGLYAAQCMMTQCPSNQDISCSNDPCPFPFDLFAHITRFFGMKVVLLGLYNGQGLGCHVELAVREMSICASRDQQIVRHKLNDNGSLSTSIHKENALSNPDDNNNNNNKINVETASKAEVEIWVRVSPGIEYIKLVVWRGKYIVGALLIGDTELDEVFENLIMNQIDVSPFGIDLLRPDIDIGDYFD